MFPYDFAQRAYVYYSVLMSQGLSNVCICLFSVAADTYGVIFTQILDGHADVLAARLSQLGRRRRSEAETVYREIVDCCENDIIILR